jgi:hypothetical protein
MKLNKLMNMALMMGLMMSALTVVTAFAQQPTADIEAKVEAFEDAALTKPIANNGSTANLTVTYVRLSVRNKGAVKAENFVVSGAVRCNDNVVYKTPDLMKMTLNPNQTQVIQVAKVQFNGTTNKVTASLVTNVMKFVPETNMANNTSKIAYTGMVVH